MGRPDGVGHGRGERAGARRERSRPEPLAASWRPTAEEHGDAEEPERRTRHGRSRSVRYGWRIYAVPLLIVISALAVFQVVGEPPDDGGGGNASAGLLGASRDAPNVPEAPIVTEAPPGQTYAPSLFSAELPPGLPFPETGSRMMDVLPGASPPVGQGDLYKYTVEVERGINLAEGNDTFGRMVQETLSDPRSWTNPMAGGISIQRVDGTPDFRVTLVSQATAREVCGYGNGLPFDTSCRITDGGEDRVYINASRWVRGAVSFQGDDGSYRRYAINHEVGHVFGNPHVPCAQNGGLAPVMMQQTFSVSNNELHELNKSVPQGTPIPQNGFVCKYNAWPFPVGGAAG